jgi:choloylglycine hydrolase
MTWSRIARMILSAFTSCALLLSLGSHAAQACTGIRLVAADGAVVHARTLEFGLDLQSEVIMVPRGL